MEGGGSSFSRDRKRRGGCFFNRDLNWDRCVDDVVFSPCSANANDLSPPIGSSFLS